jgi:dimethylaniline monooxygenase (N-oxide forming)
MGSAPTISFVASKGWKVLYTWAMGSNFNPKFRLVGPWKWEDGAAEIMATELFDVVKRSGGYVYLATYTIVPFFVFGAISLMLYTLSAVLRPFRGHVKAMARTSSATEGGAQEKRKD